MPNETSRNLIKFERRVNVLFVEKDMFVCRLDRPWIDTPLWLQGFYLRTDEEIEALRKYCNSVYIDISRGIEAEYYMEEDLELPTSTFLEKAILKKKYRKRYKNKLSLKEEIVTAQEVLEEATVKFDLVMRDIELDKMLTLKIIPHFIQPMVESVMRNSDALLLLMQIRNKNNLKHYHAIDSCVMALAFGRFMGMTIDEINKLATGALLFDIGKVKIEESILNKTQPLTNKEYGIVCSHVEYAIKFLKQDETVDEDVINMVLAHHERSDGSGYPNGLKECRIPVYARVAGVIDCYNAMCSPRSYNQTLTPFDAMQELYKFRKKYFQAEIVDKFMDCMGVYPNGSLIEFKSGEVGLVLVQNYSNRSKPQVMILLNSSKIALKTFEVIDMSKPAVSKAGKPFVIIRALNKDDFDVDMSMIYDKLKIVVCNLAIPVFNDIESITDKIFFMFESMLMGVMLNIKKIFKR